MKHGCLLIAAAILSACAPAPKIEQTRTVPVAGARLPGKVVYTDGKADIAVGGAGVADCAGPPAADRQAVLMATNDLRATHGLPSLAPDPRLRKAAQDHACDMAGRGVMTHFGTDGSKPSARVKSQGYAPRVTAENIAAGRMGAARVASEWVASPGHRANILIPQMDQFGLGRAIGSDGKTIYWAAVYAGRR